ncbi:MAG: DUF4432 family protein [Mycobacteriales bacterium]
MSYYGSGHTYGARADASWSYRGLRVGIIENETVRAVVLTDKGADVVSLVHKPTDTEFLWRSPVGIRDPRRLVSGGDSDAAWLDCYPGGWQSVFPNGGWHSSHRGADLGLHAESTLLPWDVEVVEGGPDTAVLACRVALARTPLSATRTFTVSTGSPELTVRETLVNRAGEPFPVSYGQHIVFGPPFLSGDCIVDLPGGTVHVHPDSYSDHHRLRPGARSAWPTGVGADGSPVDLRQIQAPGAGFEDLVYIEELAGGWYAITNTASGVGLAVRFPRDLYPYLWYWQGSGGGAGYPWWSRTYNVGLEPFTSATTAGLAAAIEDGSAVWLAPGASVTGELRLTPYLSRGGVQTLTDSGSLVLREG